MVTIKLASDIRGEAEAVFDTLADLRGYGRWLGNSAAYAGTADISSDPVAAGTTYVEPGPTGVRRGTVTEFDRPTRVAFHQPMTMRPRLLGVIDIHVRYTLTEADGTVHLERVVTLTFGWPLRLLRAAVVPQFRRESERTMRALKAHVEATAAR
ncbi:MAG TPA: SRPBCC family protein [Actinophytocola sp.]|jgi:uncharacterized protein YndB with AHSA1/START domain|uniref:SRPBCC family protein n=1 Tax=Actinophytocola sp. TaxID=1872138 RepID=UPI002F95E777